MPASHRAFRWAVTALYLYAAVFVLLSIDVIARVWIVRSAFPRFADVAAIFFFEASRSTVTVGAIGLGLWLTWRRHHEPAARALAVALGFATLAFTKAAAFRSFAGFVQAQLAAWLTAHQVPRGVLVFTFGSPEWAAWLALAALLLFAARFPAPVTGAAIERSGAHDRAGTFAGAALAGLDIGTLFRRLASAAVAAGWLRPLPLAAAATVLAAAYHPLRHHPAAQLVAIAVAAAGAGVVITLLRAAHFNGDASARDRIAALRTGALAAAALFLASGLLGVLSGPAEFISAALLALAPAPALYGIARAALTPAVAGPLGQSYAAEALGGTPVGG